MSTAQDDPLIAEDTPQESVPKVKRTYGRKKDAVDASSTPSSDTIPPFRTRFESLKSSGGHGGTDLMKFSPDDASNTFGWKERLALIDQQFDEEEGQKTNNPTRKSTSLLTDKNDSFAQSTSTESSSPGHHNETLLSSFMDGPDSSQSDPPSPGPSEPESSRLENIHNNPGSLESACLSEDRLSNSLFPRSHLKDVLGDVVSENPHSSDDEQNLKSELKRSLFHDYAVDKDGMEQNSEVDKIVKGKRKERANKIKKLSKKEEKESKKAHARIMADQKVSITKRAEQYTVEHLLNSVRQGRLLMEMNPGIVSSDPIQEFTSSPSGKEALAESEQRTENSGLQMASDEDMHSVQDLLTKEPERDLVEQAELQKKKNLALAKQHALEELKTLPPDFDSGDDDLEVVPEPQERTSKRTKAAEALEKKLARVAGFHVGSAKHSLSDAVGRQADKALKLAAKSTLVDRDARRTRTAMDHRDLQAAILNKATEQSMQLTKEKEEEWKRRGGKLVGKQRAILASKPLSLGSLAENLTSEKHHAGQQAESEDTATESDNGSDEEWWPYEGDSPSPRNSPRHSVPHDDEELEGAESEAHDEIATTVDGPTDNEDEDSVKPVRQVRRTTARPVLSDSEDEKAYLGRRNGRVLVPETSVIDDDFVQQIALPLEGDEENKENDTSLAIDSGDDKENVVLAQQATAGRPTIGSRQPSRIFNLEERAHQMSISPTASAEDEEHRSVRRPLQARKISELDDPFVLRSPSSAVSSNTPKSKRALSAAASPVSLKPAFDGNFGGFTQLFNDEEGVRAESPSKGLLQPAFHLRAGSDKEKSPIPTFLSPKLDKTDNPPGLPAEMRRAFRKHSKYPARDDELSLTLDTDIRPRLDITSQFRRRADMIFEKEQDFLMEEAGTSATSARSNQELYVSENGLLTQTKPEGSTPLFYRSLAATHMLGTPLVDVGDPPSTSRRLPLSTLSISDDIVSPSQQRLTRLMKGKARVESSDDGDMRSASPTARSPNAFTRLLDGAKRQVKRDKKKLGQSHFVEGEAVESDEDEMFGFGPKTKNDEEESDDDDPNAVVEELVDDRKLGDEELAEDKVLEKVKEQLEEDDAALQKYHQAAIEGKYRGKRRGGRLAVDDSESDEDEDEEARRLRRRIHKKRRIQGDKLEDLKKDERSRAFYEAYQRDIQEEDNDDFAHLASEDMDDSDEDNEDEQPEAVSTSVVREQLRQAARQQKDEKAHGNEDVLWSHHDNTSDEEFEVKEIEDQPRRTIQRRPVFGQTDVPDFDDALPRKPNKLNEEQVAQLDAWRKEQSGRNLDTGGMRGAITVTGHGSKAAGRKATSFRKHAPNQEDNKQSARKKITKSASVLASVSDRHSRFGL